MNALKIFTPRLAPPLIGRLRPKLELAGDLPVPVNEIKGWPQLNSPALGIEPTTLR
jgi:hypothetical protein